MRLYSGAFQAPPTQEQLHERCMPVDDCLEWMGPLDSAGYARVYIKGKPFRGHRLLGELLSLSGPVIRHLCHNKSCLAPAHLAGGTQRDNAADSIRDGMFAFVRLPQSAVKELRNGTLSVAEAMSRYGIAKVTAYNAKMGYQRRVV